MSLIASMQVGVWSEERQEWQPEHLAEAGFTGATVEFCARRLGAFALLQPCSALLPYSAWCLRPVGGPAPGTIALSVTVGRRRTPEVLQGCTCFGAYSNSQALPAHATGTACTACYSGAGNMLIRHKDPVKTILFYTKFTRSSFSYISYLDQV